MLASPDEVGVVDRAGAMVERVVDRRLGTRQVGPRRVVVHLTAVSPAMVHPMGADATWASRAAAHPKEPDPADEARPGLAVR